MKAFTAREHLINLKEHGVRLPDLYGERDATPHVSCEAIYRETPTAVEDLAHDVLFVTCNECSDDPSYWEHHQYLDPLDKIGSAAFWSRRLTALASQALIGDRLRPMTFTDSSAEREYMVDYVGVGSQFQRHDQLAGCSFHENWLRRSVPRSGVDLWGHVVDLSADATRQWARLTRLRPVTTHLLGGSSGDELVRAVPVPSPGVALGDLPDASVVQPYDEALQLEARRLAATATWQLIEWHTGLLDWTQGHHAVADARGLDAASLEHALVIYAANPNPDLDAPSLQEIVDSIRAATG